jgi:hypothetical protein
MRGKGRSGQRPTKREMRAMCRRGILLTFATQGGVEQACGARRIGCGENLRTFRTIEYVEM